MAEKHPIILPSDHVVSELLVGHFHQKVHHQGRGITISEIRSGGFWILGLNRIVKRTIHRCILCRKLRGRVGEQMMADLPVDRLSPCPPFTNVGCDCFGPFKIKNGRNEVKRYGVLFTCLVSRAVHIEMCFSLSSDSFFSAFRRFISIRGPASLLRCDQGTNFMGAYNDILKLGCEMIPNPPASSHRGGAWERMVGASRRVIEGILMDHGTKLDDEGLLTILHEAANIVNSRPLNIHNINDPNLEPLNANQLLNMKSGVVIAPPTLSSTTSDLYALKRWKRVQYLANLF